MASAKAFVILGVRRVRQSDGKESSWRIRSHSRKAEWSLTVKKLKLMASSLLLGIGRHTGCRGFK